MKLEVWHNILWSRYKANVFSELATIGPALGVEVKVYQIAETESDRVALSGVDRSLHRYPMVNLFEGSYSEVPFWKLAWELGRRAATTDADLTIVAGFERPEFWLQALILKIRGRRRSVFCDSTLYDNPQLAWKKAVKNIVFSLFEDAFCYGERSREFLVRHGIPADRIHIRRQAAALPPSYNADDIPRLRTAAAPPVNSPIFLYVGRLSPEKRVCTLIQAFAQSLNDHPSATLRIVGCGPLEGDLVAQAKKLGILSRVDFAGSRSGNALFELYLSATAVVLPSWSEPWGLVVNEALHMGCPVIVSDRCGCVPELVEQSPCGFVFRCDDVNDLARQLRVAPTAFAQTDAMARYCLDRIAAFSPCLAAKDIADGALQITSR